MLKLSWFDVLYAYIYIILWEDQFDTHSGLCSPAVSWFAMWKPEITMGIWTKFLISIPVNSVDILVSILCELYLLLDIPTFYSTWYWFVAIIFWKYQFSSIEVSTHLVKIYSKCLEEKLIQFHSRFLKYNTFKVWDSLKSLCLVLQTMGNDGLSPKKIVLGTIGLLFIFLWKTSFLPFNNELEPIMDKFIFYLYIYEVIFWRLFPICRNQSRMIEIVRYVNKCQISI